MIHDRGLYHEEVETCEHPFFLSQIWRSVLKCFSDMESLQLDCIYGNHETNWIITERITSIPSCQTWLMAASSRSVGMMIYLLKWGIECPYIEDIIQYAADNNHLDTLVFFTSSDFEFRDSSGMRIRQNFCPELDRAARRNHMDVVSYVLWRFPHSTAKMLKKPLVLVLQLMKNNYLDMVKMLVPRVTLITSYAGLKAAATLGHKDMVKYALNHLDPLYVGSEIPDDILVSAAKNGNLSILMVLKRKRGGFIPIEAFHQAFSWGHVAVCRYIQKRFPHYFPRDKDIVDACVHGHHEVMSLVPDNMHLPKVCMEHAARSHNYRLIKVLKKKMPDYKFKTKILRDAIRSGNSDVCITVFDCGGYKELPKDCEVDMVCRRMRKALRMFHRLGFPVYNEKSLLEASRICDLKIITDIVEEGKIKPSENVLRQALSFIYVSPENVDVRGQTFAYLDNYAKKLHETRELESASVAVEQPPPSAPGPEKKNTRPPKRHRKRKRSDVVVSDDEDDDETDAVAPGKKKRKGKVFSDAERAVLNDMVHAKRLKHIHHQSHK